MTNTANVAKWTAALRSGEYKQGKGLLKDPEGRYCCLGVACEVAIKNGLDLKIEVIPDESGATTYDGSYLTLPKAVADWLGYVRSEPKLGGKVLTAMNDHEDKTFEEIADHIDAYIDEDPAPSYE